MKILSARLDPVRIEFLSYGRIHVIENVSTMEFALHKLHKYHTRVETPDEVKQDLELVLQEQATGLRP